MNCKIACEILEIPHESDLRTFNEYSIKQVRRLYYKQCLLYHPDKNPGNDTAAEKFREVHTAYEFVIQMKESEGIPPGTCDMKSASMFTEVLQSFLREHGLDDSINRDIAEAARSGVRLFQQTALCLLDTETLITLLTILEEYRSILHISDNVYAEAKTAIQQQLDERKHAITLNPTIDDLFHHNVFVFYSEVLERKLYLPMWHPEMTYNIGKIRLVVNAILPSEQSIDDTFHVGSDNTIHICIRRKVQDLLCSDNITICLGVSSFQIPVLKLRIATEQEYVMAGRGIPVPNNTDIYNVSQLSDIIVTITLV